MNTTQHGITPSAILAAARAGMAGEVIRLSRRAQGVTQPELAARTSFSQSTISRIERGKYTPDIPSLREFAKALDIPPILLGLAEHPTDGQGAQPAGDPVKRREFLQAAAALAEAAITHRKTSDSLTAIHAITTAQRRLDATTASRELAAPVLAHMTMTSRRHANARSEQERKNLAAALSEISGYAAWLHWDMHDVGSARTYYAGAVRAADSTGEATLHAYMLGSFATLAVYEGDAIEGLALLQRAAHVLGSRGPAIATAWLACLEAVAQADAGDARRAWQALDRADDALESVEESDPPPWPWVFQFDHAKVARYRLTCAARLKRPEVALSAAEKTGEFLTSGHAKQRALAQIDLATAHLHAREPERAFALARDAVATGRGVQSGRVIDAARKFRRQYTGAPNSPVVKAFDRQLYATHF